MISKDQQPPTKGAVLSFHNISYRVQMKSGFLCHQRTFEILSNINGIMKPGLNAIMGPSGGGTSSLLDVLAARKDPCGLSGDVLINGAPRPANFKSNSGYVVQDDILMGTLTVRENLQFSAALRLPMTMTNHEKSQRINKVIEELDLSEVADSKVQSRGDRKRASIAVELITDPSILFLDEPTADLDFSTANAVFSLLERLSKQGRTIIFSIHRPQYPIFKLFDSLTLLASGKLLFHGPAQMAVEYFASADYRCGPYNNPADFFLDVISEDYSAVTSNREEEDYEADETEELVQTEPGVQLTPEFYTNSSFYRDIKAELDQLSGAPRRSLACQEMTCATSFCHQLRWITWRSFKNLCGFSWVTVFQIIATTILALVIGATFLGLKNACTNIQHRAWVFYVLTVFQCVTSMSAREIFVAEKNLFLHEYISGYYRVSPYFFGKLLSDLLPRCLLIRIIFTCILYFMIGLKPGVGTFFIMMFTILMVAYSSTSMVLAVGIAKNAASMETVLVTLYFAFMMVFLGMTLNFGNMTPQLSWLQYLSIPHSGYMILQYNEFLGQNFCSGLSEKEISGCSSYVICSGEEFLTIQGINLSPWSLWKNLMALAGVTAVFLTITYVKLLFLQKHPSLL